MTWHGSGEESICAEAVRSQARKLAGFEGDILLPEQVTAMELVEFFALRRERGLLELQLTARFPMK